jgi:hypothetical protein
MSDSNYNAPRDIGDVYDKIIVVIPDEYVEFKNELTNYIKSLCYTAPELRCSSDTYMPFARILLDHIPNICELTMEDELWKKNVRDIFRGLK